jgi:hemerythrin
MQLSKFPPIHCHEREHAKVMEVAAAVRERVAAGEFELGRTLAAGLAEWFEIHADTMDRVLALWLRQGPAACAPAGCAPGGCGAED